MPRYPVRLLALSALLLPIGLSACKKDDAGATAPSGGALAKVPPPAGKAWSDVVALTPDGGHLMGNPDAPIKLLEYGSLSCPHCAHFSQQAMPALADKFVDTGRVSYEFRSFSIHPQDVPLTVMVECAPIDSYFALVEQIYANFGAMNAPLEDSETLKKAQATMTLPPAQRWPEFADAAGYTAFFAQRGLPTDKVHACLADVTKAKAVADRAQRYGDAGIDQTPTLVLNGSKLDIAEWGALKTALENAGAR